MWLEGLFNCTVNSITIQSGLRHPVALSFVPMNSLLLRTSPPPRCNTMLTPQQTTFSATILLHIQPSHVSSLIHVLFLFSLTKTIVIIPLVTDSSVPVASHSDWDSIGVKRVDISKERHTFAKLRFKPPETQWAAALHTIFHRGIQRSI